MTRPGGVASTLVIRPIRPADYPGVIDLWRRARRAAFPYNAFQQGTTIEQDTAYFEGEIVGRCEVWLASTPGKAVGFLALADGWVQQLYVDPDDQGAGVGTSLILRAMMRSPEGLRLHVFRRNDGARRFYERHGFVAGAEGVSPPPENEPDVEYRWVRRP